MKDATILKAGIGSVIAAVRCSTPTPAVVLGALGLSACLGRVEDVLLPALAVFLGLTAYGLWRRQRAVACCATEIEKNRESA